MPWIAKGLLLSVFSERDTSRRKNTQKHENYGSEGLVHGMCDGAALSTALKSAGSIGMRRRGGNLN